MSTEPHRSLVNAIVDRLQANHVDLRLVSLGEMKNLIREAQSKSRGVNSLLGSKLAT